MDFLCSLVLAHSINLSVLFPMFSNPHYSLYGSPTHPNRVARESWCNLALTPVLFKNYFYQNLPFHFLPTYSHNLIPCLSGHQTYTLSFQKRHSFELRYTTPCSTFIYTTNLLNSNNPSYHYNLFNQLTKFWNQLFPYYGRVAY